MSDIDTRRSKHRSYDRDDYHRRKASPQDRKRHRSRSPSTERYDKPRRRPRSPLEGQRRRSDHYHHQQEDDRSNRARRDVRDNEPSSRRRSRSAENSRYRKQRSPSHERTNGSRRHDEDKQLVRTRHGRDSSRDRRRRRHSRSPPSTSPPPVSSRKALRKSSRSPPSHRSKGPLPSQQAAFSATQDPASAGPGEKQKPNYGTSGKLAAETNTVKIGGEAIVLKYHEPPEARKPPSSQAWRMYEFKGDNTEPLSTTEMGSRSCWLFGRETAVVDFLIEHPSCSKQHAVVQFRYVEKRSEFGDKIGSVKPYILDLESANGTSINGERIPDSRYMELKSGDSVAFGESTREYVVLLPPKEKMVI